MPDVKAWENGFQVLNNHKWQSGYYTQENSPSQLGEKEKFSMIKSRLKEFTKTTSTENTGRNVVVS